MNHDSCMNRKSPVSNSVGLSNPSLTEKQELVLQALVTGMNQTDAAKHVGVSREYVCRLCQKDHFLGEVDKRVRRMKTLLAPIALANVVRIAETAESERVRLDANLGILDRAGHGRSDNNIIAFKHGELTVNIDLS
jgi:hypothetical protein